MVIERILNWFNKNSQMSLVKNTLNYHGEMMLLSITLFEYSPYFYFSL